MNRFKLEHARNGVGFNVIDTTQPGTDNTIGYFNDERFEHACRFVDTMNGNSEHWDANFRGPE